MNFVFTLELRSDHRHSPSMKKCPLWDMRAYIVGFMEETLHLIVMKWHTCLWNFPSSWSLMHWIMLVTIFGCYNCSLYLAFYIIENWFIHIIWLFDCVPRDETHEWRSQCHVVVLCTLLNITKDCSLAKGRIPVSSLEACLRMRWASLGSTTYATRYARSEEGGVPAT